MNKREKELAGALIGLAKACNVHAKTENTDNIIISSLAAMDQSPEKNNEHHMEELLQKVRKEKLAVAPDCATCQAPCGNTDEYDFEQLQQFSTIVRNLKIQLLQVSYQVAFGLLHGTIEDVERVTGLLYKALCIISYDMDAERVRSVLEELSACINK